MSKASSSIAASSSESVNLAKFGLGKLNNFQKKVLRECVKKGSGGISLPVGSGKTLLSLVLALAQTKHAVNQPNKPCQKYDL